ncbi:MAG TPA: hypothetical protein VER04_07860, partial [Polyangiaceae bacterium]|nr:hypothetical protein [Polyangiaceae bacterium]
MAHVQPELRSFHARPPSPFAFVSAAEVDHASEHERALDAPTHRLLQQGALEPGEFERDALEALEVMGLWGSTILFARHLNAAETFTIGESSAAEHVDFELAAAQLGAASARLVELQDGTPHVVVPRGAEVSVKRASDPYALPSQATSVPLLSGTVVELKLGMLKFRFANVPAGKTTPRAGLASVDRSLLAAFASSFAAVAALIGGFAFWMPALGLTDDEGLDNERLILMKQYLSANAQRELEEQQSNTNQA